MHQVLVRFLVLPIRFRGERQNRVFLAALGATHFAWSNSLPACIVTLHVLYVYTRQSSTMANHYQHSSERSFVRPVEVSIEVENSVHTERHYAVAEIAEMWNLSADKVRELFADEPGVLVIGQQHAHRKRRYVTLRVPKSVAERVHRRLSTNSRSH